MSEAVTMMVIGGVLWLIAFNWRRNEVQGYTAVGILAATTVIDGLFILLLDSGVLSAHLSAVPQIKWAKTLIIGVGIGAILHSLLVGTFFRRQPLDASRTT
jgi:hypothetical protein